MWAVKTTSRDFIALVQQLKHGYVNINEHLAIKSIKNPEAGEIKRLQDTWYSSLATTPDYSVYADAYYLCDIWLCWKLYSSRAIRDIERRQIAGKTGRDYFTEVHTVLDLGSGFAYTTHALCDLFPQAKVTATNIADTWQYNFSQANSGGRYTVTNDHASVGKIDLLFASEYFEHHDNTQHIYAVLQSNQPRYVVVANGYTGTAIGHFLQYNHRGTMIENRKMNRVFKEIMLDCGYKREQTTIWNNRPQVWSKT